MYIYLDKQGVVKEIINDEALRQSASNVNEIYIYYEGLQEADIGSVLATYGLPDGTITDEMEVATQTQESEIPYNAERDLKYFQYYKAYPFYHFAIADLALAQEGVVRLMIRLAQKDGEYIKVAGLICFDVEGELVKEDHGVSLAQYNYLVKAWADTKECLPLDGSKAMQGNLDMGAHKVLLNGKTLKDNNGALNYNGSDLAKKSDTSSLQSQIDTINATQNVVDIVGTKAELNAYDTKDLHANDKIEVLADESQSNANTIYEWNGNTWSLVGSKAPYYSKVESDARYNELKAKSYDKDTASYVSGHVPDSALVKGSLDSIYEQVDATKTQVETNKTNIAKNTQDIDNLSAVMPTDINVDANGYAILEHDGTEITGQTKKVKFAQTDKSVSFNEVTIPTASALKTKDGTSFGGGSSIYNGTEYLPTFDIATLKDVYLPLTGGNIDGNLTVKGQLNIPNYSVYVGNAGIILHETTVSAPPLTPNSFYSYSLGSWGDSKGIYFGISKNVFMKGREDYDLINVGSKGTLICSVSNPISLKLYSKSDKRVIQELTISENGAKINNKDIITTEQLDAKQSTLYRHTIEIIKDNEASLILTTESTISTEINTMDKFISAFTGSELACMCALNDNNNWNIHYIGIQVGTTLNDTSMMSTNVLDTGMTFTDVFGTSGYTMVDKVKPL